MVYTWPSPNALRHPLVKSLTESQPCWVRMRHRLSRCLIWIQTVDLCYCDLGRYCKNKPYPAKIISSVKYLGCYLQEDSKLFRVDKILPDCQIALVQLICRFTRRLIRIRTFTDSTTVAIGRLRVHIFYDVISEKVPYCGTNSVIIDQLFSHFCDSVFD